MRIHLVCQNFAGAFAADIAVRWAERGHDVVAFTADAAAGTSSQSPRLVAGIPTPYDRTSLGHRLLSRLTFVGSAVRARRAHAQIHGEADVVVSVGGSPEVMFSDSARRGLRPRFITWLYDLLPDTLLAHLGPSPMMRVFEPALHALFSRVLNASDDVVAISPRMAERVQSRVTSPRVWAIPLWAPVALDAAPAPGPGQAGRGPSDKAGAGKVVSYHGNLGLAYDFETVISAAALLGREGISFVLGGVGSRREDLARRIARDNLQHVTIVPPVPGERLWASMSAGDVHLLPLRPGWDGVAFPSKLFASLAVGRPVVITGPIDSEAADLVRRGGCGEVLPASPPLLASALRGLMADDARRDAMGRAGRNLYESRFSIAKALAAWDQVLGVAGPDDPAVGAKS